MKDKIIETAGKTWKFLGQNGESEISTLSRQIKEKDSVVLQAVGWLAREDKINYTTRNRKIFVALVEGELAAFNNLVYHMNAETVSAQDREKAKNNRLKSLK